MKIGIYLEQSDFTSPSGNHLIGWCEKAALVAADTRVNVHFEFNGIHVIVEPGNTAQDAYCDWKRRRQYTHKAMGIS